MHELSIAMSIVEMAEEEASQRNVRVSAIHLRLGILSGVVKEALLSSFAIASDGTMLEGSQLVIEEVPVEIFCARCVANHALSAMQWFICPKCGAATPTVVHGKELEVTALEIQ